MKYHIIIKPEHINGKLAALGGKLLAHLPNYTRLYEELPVLKDESLQVFMVEPSADDIHVYKDDSGINHFIWHGDKGSRGRSQDLVTVEILPVGATAGSLLPTDVARAAMEGFPEDVQVAAVLSKASDKTLHGIPEVSPARASAMRIWAMAKVNEFISSKTGINDFVSPKAG
jgi:hypothetical protein